MDKHLWILKAIKIHNRAEKCVSFPEGPGNNTIKERCRERGLHEQKQHWRLSCFSSKLAFKSALAGENKSISQQGLFSSAQCYDLNLHRTSNKSTYASKSICERPNRVMQSRVQYSSARRQAFPWPLFFHQKVSLKLLQKLMPLKMRFDWSTSISKCQGWWILTGTSNVVTVNCTLHIHSIQNVTCRLCSALTRWTEEEIIQKLHQRGQKEESF